MLNHPPLEAVLFDAGGTLIRLDFEWMASELGTLGAGVDASTLRRAEIEGRRRYDSSRAPAAPAGNAPAPLGSAGDVRAYFGGMLEAAGVTGPLLDRALERFFLRHEECGLWTRPMEGARQAMDSIGELGLRRAVVSNSDGRAEKHLQDCGVHSGLEIVIDSHRVGIEKPDAGIFRVALGHLGVAPESALYVGDIRSVDETGARAAGMWFVLIDPYGDYADGIEAIRSIDQLGGWIETRFHVPGRQENRIPKT
jgi:HAD superfamily hydrolase (TIGR01509 family)